MWIEMLSWWCRLFGYASCGQLSTFEAIALAAVGLFAAFLALGLIFGAIGAAFAALDR